MTAAKARAAATPAVADPEQVATKRLERAQRLYEALAELEEKRGLILNEIARILAGTVTTNECVKQVATAFMEQWSARYKAGYAWRGDDTEHVKRLLQSIGRKDIEHGTRELVKRIATYIRSDEPFYRKARHNFGVFVRSVNDLADDTLPLAGDIVHAPPVGCKHSPPCASDHAHTLLKSRELRSAT